MNAKVPTTIDERMGATYNKDVENFHVGELFSLESYSTLAIGFQRNLSWYNTY
jgi:hypothetical protein